MNIKKHHEKFYVKLFSIAIFLFTLSHCSYNARKVMSCQIPAHGLEFELWEQPVAYNIINTEYKTWVVIKSKTEVDRIYIIDEEYISFRLTRILMSDEKNLIRIETSGIGNETHMIGEYNILNRSFSATSDISVFGKKGWTLLKEIRVR